MITTKRKPDLEGIAGRAARDREIEILRSTLARKRRR